MAEDNNKQTSEISGAELSGDRMSELQSSFEQVEGKPGAKVITEVENVGFGPGVEYIEITFKYETKAGKVERHFFAKKLIRSENQRYIPFLNVNSTTSQQKEYELLNLYGALKVNVPSPCLKTRGIIASPKIKGDSLETLLDSEADEGKRADLIRKVTLSTDSLHDTGERLEVQVLNDRFKNSILRTAMLLKKSESYFTSLAASAEELSGVKDDKGEKELISYIKEKCSDNFAIFNSFFEVLDNHFIIQKPQLIHGDMTTYHVIIDKDGEPWFIDFGKPKFANAVFDLIPLYISQDTNLSIKTVEEIFRERLTRKYVTGDRVDEEFKSLYLGGCFSNIGRGSKNRVLRITSPADYAQFVAKHPSYDRSLIFYKDSTQQLVEHILKNSDRFRIKGGEYQNTKNFLNLLDRLVSVSGYSLYEDRCPMSARGHNHI